ncbi:MAG: thioesterase [Candidatus Onthomonas sp.]|nr:thioesterase [Candidatus Onthomonas sp.]
MIYSYERRIAMSHVDENWKLNPASALDLLQNCAMFHTVEAGSGPDVLKAENLAWVINSWNVYFDRPCDFLDTVRLSTWAHGFDRVFAHRNFLLENSRGETCIRADTVWILMQMDKQFPVRMKKEQLEKYATNPRLDMPPMERRVELPEGMEDRPSFTVPHYAVDANHHMNNVWYVRFALEYLPQGFQLKRLRVEYAKSARYRDKVYPRVRQEPGMFWVELADESGKSFVKIEFSEHAES